MFNVATDIHVDYRIDGKLTPVSVQPLHGLRLPVNSAGQFRI